MMGGGAGENPADKAKADALYEDREPKKIIRIITVTAYMFSVSFVGIVLSAYYIFLWHPPNPRLMHAHAISAHLEARVDYRHGAEETSSSSLAASSPPSAGAINLLSRMASPRGDDNEHLISLLGAEARASESLKTRRDIVKNVNAILRANFEKGRSSEPPKLEATNATTPAPRANASVA